MVSVKVNNWQVVWMCPPKATYTTIWNKSRMYQKSQATVMLKKSRQIKNDTNQPIPGYRIYSRSPVSRTLTRLASRCMAVGKCPLLYCSAGRQSTTKYRTPSPWRRQVKVIFWDIKEVKGWNLLSQNLGPCSD